VASVTKTPDKKRFLKIPVNKGKIYEKGKKHSFTPPTLSLKAIDFKYAKKNGVFNLFFDEGVNSLNLSLIKEIQAKNPYFGPILCALIRQNHIFFFRNM